MSTSSLGDSNSLNVLLIEDNHDHIKMIERYLSNSDYLSGKDIRVNAVQKLAAAVHWLGQEHYDAVILDLNLSDADAYETVSQVLSYVHKSPVIILTSLKENRLALKSLTNGVQDYIIKEDITDDILGRSISYAIERHRAENRIRLQANRSETLFKMARLSLQNESVDFIIQQSCQWIAESLDIDVVEILKYIPEANSFKILFVHGLSQADLPENGLIEISGRNQLGYLSELLKMDAFKEETPRLLNLNGHNIYEVSPHLSSKLLKSGMVAPFGSLYGNELGILGAYTKAHRIFGKDERYFFMTAVNTLRTAIRRIDLENEVKKRMDELEAIDSRKNEFLAFFAHELRNPLVAVQAGVETLKHSQNLQDNDETVVKRMSKQLNQASRLLNDLLDISRISHGLLHMQMKNVSVQSLVTHALEVAQNLFEKKSQKLVLDIHPDLNMDGDETRLTQVLVNLLHNASKFTPTGENICVSAQAHGEWMELRVVDSGPGIQEAMKDKVFEPFVCGDRTGESVGLGLALAKQIVELHQGSIEVKNSEKTHGAEFIIRLPLAAHHRGLMSSKNDTPPPLSLGKRPKLRIAVIDDNQLAAEHAKWCLELYGHDVYISFNGKEGVQLVRDISPDLVFLDIIMPELDGYETVKILKQEYPEIPVVALTSFGDEKTKAKALQVGFTDFLTKDADPNFLPRYIEERYPLSKMTIV